MGGTKGFGQTVLYPGSDDVRGTKYHTLLATSPSGQPCLASTPEELIRPIRRFSCHYRLLQQCDLRPLYLAHLHPQRLSR